MKEHHAAIWDNSLHIGTRIDLKTILSGKKPSRMDKQVISSNLNLTHKILRDISRGTHMSKDMADQRGLQ